MKGKVTILVFGIALLLSLFLSQNLPAEVNRVIHDTGSVSQDNSQLDKASFGRKTKKLQIPFIANNGQMDEQVRFYAMTFGGTVFVTKEGEIVYLLPSGRDVPGGASRESGRGHEAWGQGSRGAEAQGGKVVSGWHGQAPLVRADAELVVAYVYSPLLHADNANCPPDRVFAKSLIAAYLPGLPKETTQRVVSTSTPPNYHPHSEIQNPKSAIPMRGVTLKETIVGAKIGGITGEQPAVTTVNYFTGNDQSKWKTNVPTYSIINLGEVYKGIELSLKAYSDNVEKLFCVKPGASPEQIKISLSGIQPPESPFVKGDLTKSPLEKGARGLYVNEHGELEAETELGTVKFTRPMAYQEIAGKRMEVDVEYRLSNPKSAIQNPKSEYGFTVASYDKTKDLIIDPLLASTYLGGSADEYGNSLTLDTSGNVYVTGYTMSTNFPTMSGAYDISFNGGDYDVFVSKLNSGLTSLLASTYVGGSSKDYGNSLAIDTSGNVYVTGYTYSTNFPTMSGAYDTSFNGGANDVFVSKLNSGLTGLLASTFLGGSENEIGSSLTLDTSGNVYVMGFTNSRNFPMTSGAYDTSYNGSGDGIFDVFVSKLNSGLTSLLTSTYLGGSGYESGNSLTLDTSGNVLVTGDTTSTNFPTTSGAYDTSFNGGYRDVFVSKLNSGLTSLLSSTYLGGSADEYGNSLTLDTSGNVFVTGYTGSANFPTTSGAYDTAFNGSNDVFVSKLNSGLTSLLASTFLGGSQSDSGNALARDTSGNVYVTGDTASTNFPTTSGAYDTSFNGSNDVFVSKLNSGLTSLLASTYLGGSDDDWGGSLTRDSSGNVYVAGETKSTNFPAISGVYDTSTNGNKDVFVTKLDGNLSAGGSVIHTIGTLVTDDLWIRAIINTEDKGPIEAVWKKGGESTNARGDRAIWGHFYASPNDESWGSANNPDLYVKIWYDVVDKRWDVNYFHVSVPDIEVYSQYPYNTGQQMHGLTTMSRRYIRQYYKGGSAAQDENYEDGLPATGYYQGNNPTANNTINYLSIGSTIKTEEKGPVSGIWRLGGTDTTARGDQVVWGFFYANPSDVSWGNKDNPDLYVKIWFDVSGRIDVNFFHVSVPEIEAYSGYPWSGSYMQKGTTIMADRYILQQYQKVDDIVGTWSLSGSGLSGQMIVSSDGKISSVTCTFPNLWCGSGFFVNYTSITQDGLSFSLSSSYTDKSKSILYKSTINGKFEQQGNKFSISGTWTSYRCQASIYGGCLSDCDAAGTLVGEKK